MSGPVYRQLSLALLSTSTLVSTWHNVIQFNVKLTLLQTVSLSVSMSMTCKLTLKITIDSICQRKLSVRSLKTNQPWAQKPLFPCSCDHCNKRAVRDMSALRKSCTVYFPELRKLNRLSRQELYLTLPVTPI